MNAKQLYETYIEKLNWREKLELLELLIQSTMELISQEKEKTSLETQETSSKQVFKEKLPTESDSGLTNKQIQLLKGPVMAEEDYMFYKQKKEHFVQ